ncbi:MAG: phosphoenolpyruvate synthase regulatory protein [Gammaproteobacteria bacterium]|nr:MAG: phosphoenolpyruvate synthase regulatory protein [Gammaproteobacteria bacterium]
MKKCTVFYVSDSTGITAEDFGKSLLTQFDEYQFEGRMYPFITDEKKIENVISAVNYQSTIDEVSPLVFSTLVDEKLSAVLENSNALVFSLYTAKIKKIEQVLKTTASHKIGKFHSTGELIDYKKRINTINYALNSDDGMNTKKYDEADIILLGASRSGKTPTCVYLAMHFHLKAANYPIVEQDLEQAKLPRELLKYKNKCFGLTIKPKILCKIRQERYPDSKYAKLDQCQYEIKQVENIYKKYNINYIDTSKISIEEISTKICKNMKKL